MTVSIERIRELRNRYSTGNSLMSHAPQEVWRTSKDLLSIMNELLEYRDAEAQAAADPDPEHIFAEEQAEPKVYFKPEFLAILKDRTKNVGAIMALADHIWRGNPPETFHIPLEGMVS